MRGVLACMTGLVVASSGCLVTERLEFVEPNVAAILTPVAPVKFTWLSADLACETPTDSGMSGEPKQMRFEVTVADANEDDLLIGRVLVNGRIVDRPEVEGGGKVQRENLSTCVEHARFTARCNYVVVAVSRRFQDSDDNLAVEEPGDLATVSFFVLRDGEDNVEPEDCERQLMDGGTE